MQRYFIPSENMEEQKAVLRGDDAHHLIRVMRAEAGDRVIVSNGIDREYLAEVTEFDKDSVHLALIEQLSMNGEPNTNVWIAQSLPKGDKLETVIQKGTEIGASAFIPFISARTVVQYDAKKEAKRLERWRKIAKEAAEQAHRSRIPDVKDTVSWRALLQLAKDTSLSLFCYEKEDGRTLGHALREHLRQPNVSGPILIIVGPEGGFTEEEVREAEAAGAVSVGLGRRILRTETAGLVAVSCVMYETGEI